MASRAERQRLSASGAARPMSSTAMRTTRRATYMGSSPACEHAAEPVERGVGVGVADGFVQGGDDVVVLLAVLVVEQDAALQGFGGDLAW